MGERRARHRANLQDFDYALALFEDPSLVEHFEIYETVFCQITRYTLLPELLRIFGTDTLLRFLDLFKGTTIAVPSPEVLAEIARDAIIFLKLEDDATEDTVGFIQKRYDLNHGQIHAIHTRVSSWVKQANLLKYPDGSEPLDEQGSNSEAQ